MNSWSHFAMIHPQLFLVCRSNQQLTETLYHSLQQQQKNGHLSMFTDVNISIAFVDMLIVSQCYSISISVTWKFEYFQQSVQLSLSRTACTGVEMQLHTLSSHPSLGRSHSFSWGMLPDKLPRNLNVTGLVPLPGHKVSLQEWNNNSTSSYTYMYTDSLNHSHL